MAVLMGSAMAIIMLGFMWGMMYKNLTVNVAIIVGASSSVVARCGSRGPRRSSTTRPT